MISWQTTVAPATSSTKSVIDGITGTLFGVGGFPPETRETHYTNVTTYYTTENWSRTTTSSTEEYSDVIYVTFITDPTSTPPGTDASQDPFNSGDGGQIVLSLTATRNQQTSTISTFSISQTTTATTTRNISQWTFDSSSSSFGQSADSVTALTTSTTSSTSSSAATTTATVTELDPSYYATVYRANGSNEILWCLAPPTQSFNGDFVAASAVATTTTKTTFQPWSVTENLFAAPAGSTGLNSASFVTFAQTSQTATAPELTTVHNYTHIATTDATATNITFGLPMSTGTIPASKGTTEGSQTTITIASSQSVVAFRTTVQTRFANGQRVGPQFFNSIDTIAGASLTNSYQTVSKFLSNTNAVRTTEYEESYANDTITRKTDAGGMGFALKTQGVTTSIGSTNVFLIGQSGVAGSAASVSAFYTVNTTLTLDEEFTVLDQRNVTTIMPGTYLATAGGSESGIVSFSGLDASFTLQDSTSQTSGTFSFSANGSSQTALVTKSQNIEQGNELETLAYTIAPGVYSDVARSSTFSTTGGAYSVAGTSSFEGSVLQPLSFIVPAGSNVDAAPLVWTATRNQTQAP